MLNVRAVDIAEELREAHLVELQVGAQKMELVAALAEAYCLPPGAEQVHGHLVDELTEEFYPFGGPGAPKISEWAVPEIAALLQLSRRKTKTMVQGAVHLKWQLPELFAKMRNLEVEADRAVQGSYLVADLPTELARAAVERWSKVQHRYGFTGAMKKLEQIVAELDPARVEEEARHRSQRHVKIGLGSFAVGYVEGKVDVLDAQLFDAALNQIAELLAQLQDDDSTLDVRRAKAIGVLSRLLSAASGEDVGVMVGEDGSR